MSQKTLERLEHLRQLNSSREWVNNQLYRLMYKEDLYIVAYEAVLQKLSGEHDGREAPPLAQLRLPLQTGGR